MNRDFHFAYDFFPVGQGLFAAGFLLRSGVCGFAWVYDCGTSSDRALMSRALKRLGGHLRTHGYVDLLILSHFDHDHISGVCELLKSFKVKRLMLPYMPLAERLVLAFEEGIDATDPMIEFFVNPVSYLLGQGDQGIDEVVFVPASGSDGPAPTDDSPNVDQPSDEGNFQIRPRPRDASSDDERALAPTDGRGSAGIVFLRPGSVITSRSWLWEFVPYNDDAPKAITDDFVRDVAAKRDKLLSADVDERGNCLEELRESYDAHFGSKSRKRNIISLFVYAGPLTGHSVRQALVHACRWVQKPPRQPFFWCYEWERLWNLHGSLVPCSVLYSGDGYLNTKSRLKKLTTYLGGKRMSQVGVFQVMHHGAKANWREGVAIAIAPVFSVFCSDPEYQYKHPAAGVVRDFWRFGPVQVDKTMGFTVEGWWQHAR